MVKYELRETTLDILMRVGESGGYSHLLIDKTLKNKSFSQRDEALLTEIVYGTIQRKLTLNFFLEAFVDKKKKVTPWVKWLLYMSIYQMHYLDKVPDHAVIHESVEIAKKKGHKGMASFVNGVLRAFQRHGAPDISTITDEVKRLSIETSHPAWLIKRWVDMYGIDITRKMCLTNLEQKPMSVRVQVLKWTREDAIKRLEEEGFQVESSSLSPQGILINEGNILRSSLFQQGAVTIQDQSSMLVSEILHVSPGMTVLDACSAPGGKTTHIAEKMKNEGMVYAYDLHEKKAKLVTKKATELDLTIIEAKQGDARNLADFHQNETFDRILLDAPCSGLGVLRGKPDIKYNKVEEDIAALAAIQLNLLEKVAPLLKKDGKLLYSTCTVDKTENEQVVQAFLEKNTEFEVDLDFQSELPVQVQSVTGLSKLGLQLFPQDFNTDGFFLTRLKKK
ncbi:16S rRNA (cytosine(967)-C(5))-methyltransferase RsmB [Aquibacillus sp. 3ASR75-11]|uniref:16S rRNA (cytosine(967)-C(5))-methyltransferase n=1 Tax=Terrihalobacillus insolitus TaxID=2950438 RepID=A0A9X4AMM3_9BACI|nr:16S rRNA (cytosine(967)-C(5))-methyltransferase RsmB [Terrihalobacillus insolitus]MDC3412896.1 16S rRNA (cytosine(967)-C(5))-methyltransferase RsmB [Terrihalobacillus insolitus]MDC3423625.1 16S rRNA (cytosine(967)-C(5))-methyltransferase RsmB [Terrihalobacillus insolitus]